MQPTLDYLKASNGASNASLMTIQAVRAPGATSITTNTVAGVPANFLGTMGTPHTFTDPVTGEPITIISEDSAVDFAGHIDAGKVEIDQIAPGYADKGSKVGDIIILRPTTQWADLMAQFLSPTGLISPFAGSLAPDNWLLCNGDSLLRADFPRLFDVIGTSYGSIDGTHFNVPDLRSRMPVGVGQGKLTIPVASVDAGGNALIVSAANFAKLKNGMAITVTSDTTMPGNVGANTVYYVLKSTVIANGVKLSTTMPNSVASVEHDITSAGAGVINIVHTYSNRTLGDFAGAEDHLITRTEMPSHDHATSREGFMPSGTGSFSLNDRSADRILYSDAAVHGGNGENWGDIRSLIEHEGGSMAHSLMNPYLALNYIIKT